jgi:hypothetical protein
LDNPAFNKSKRWYFSKMRQQQSSLSLQGRYISISDFSFQNIPGVTDLLNMYINL